MSKSMNKADRWFSIYIRLKHADQYGNVRCVISGKMHYWKNVDAGHFISRRYQATRYDERNVHPQNRASNRFFGGDQASHAVYIERTYGQGTVEELHNKSRMVCRRTATDFEYLAEEFKAKAKLEAMKRNIKL